MNNASPRDLVSVQNVSKYFGKKGSIVTALNDVTINISQSENLALVGETGSGKTTLGRITCGLETQSKGKITLLGKEIKDYRKNELWKVTQYIHQDPYGAIDPLETVGEILERPLRFLLGIQNGEKRDEMMKEMIVSSGLNETYLDKKGSDLSGGEKQRILIARAFIVKPKYVVIDEPTTMIDFIHRDEIIETLRAMGASYGATLLLITHDIMVVPKIANRVVVLLNGEIIENGETHEILKNPYHPYTAFLSVINPQKLLGNKKIMDYLSNYGQNKSKSGVTGHGCAYAPLCPLADVNCRENDPSLVEATSNHYVKCFKPGQFTF